MTRRTPVIAAALLVAATAALGVARVTLGVGRAPTPGRASTAAASPSPVAVTSPTAQPLDELTIASMRARAYPASTLVAVRSDGEQGGYVDTIESFHSDGLLEDALVSIPDGAAPASGWPVIVLNHGYTDPATYQTDGPDYGAFISAFARAGYMVVKPDYRGHGQSQGVASGGHLSPVYAYDLLNLVSTLRADHRVDPGRVGLFGHSMGGAEVLRALVISRDIKAAELLAGVVGSMYDVFYNWPQTPQSTVTPVAQQVAVENSVIATYGTPAGNPGFWDSVSAINFVGSITATIQIDQDVGDTAVPKLFSDHLAAALSAAGKPAEYNLYPGDDHQFLHNRDAVLAATVGFYRAHL
jgi:dipeptidyl aminopeptidase/acylaminoacyl peptidase